MNDNNWVKIFDVNAENLVIGDLDGNNEDDVIGDFGSNGFWLRTWLLNLNMSTNTSAMKTIEAME